MDQTGHAEFIRLQEYDTFIFVLAIFTVFYNMFVIFFAESCYIFCFKSFNGSN